VYGILVVVVILFAPEGVLGVIRRTAARVRRRGAERGRTEPAATA
jgi:branched-chain amino acid transport system permease protein